MSGESRIKSDTDRLMQAISALSAAPDSVGKDGRLLTKVGDDASDLLEALLTEVNETVLHRNLVFKSEINARLVIEAYERRILRAKFFDAESVGDNDIVAQKYLTTEDADELYQTVSRIIRPSKSMRVLSELPDYSVRGAVEGVTCSLLWQIHRAGAKAGGVSKPSSDLFEKSTDIALAFVMMKEGCDPTCWGSEKECTALIEFCDSPAAVACSSDISVWAGGLGDNVSVARVRTTDAVLLALLNEYALDDFLRLWRPVTLKGSN